MNLNKLKEKKKRTENEILDLKKKIADKEVTLKSIKQEIEELEAKAVFQYMNKLNISLDKAKELFKDYARSEEEKENGK